MVQRELSTLGIFCKYEHVCQASHPWNKQKPFLVNQANFLLGYEVIIMIIVYVTTKEKSLGTNFNQENWMLVIRLMYTIFDFRNTKMCLMCLNLWFYGTYATSKGFRTHWTLIIGLQGHMGNFKKIKDYLKRTPWMRKKFNDLSDMFQSHVCRHGLRTPN